MRKIKTRRRPEIAAAALAVADEKGLDAVSMRAVAARLGLTPMALYGYFRNKDELLDGIYGSLLAELPGPEPGEEWRERLRSLARAVRAVGHRHPAAFPLLLTRPPATADGVRAVERVYRVLLDAGVGEEEVARVERMVSTFVLGFVLSEVTERFSAGALEPARRRRLLGAAELPAHHRLGPRLDAPVDWDREFETDMADVVAMVEKTARKSRREE